MMKRENSLIAKEKAAANGVNLSHASGIALQQETLYPQSNLNSYLCETRPYNRSFPQSPLNYTYILITCLKMQ